MRCLRCGYPKDAHCRADGSCMWARCDAFVDKWPDEPAPAAPLITPATAPKLAAPSPKASEADDAEK